VQIPTKSPADSEMMSPGVPRWCRLGRQAGIAGTTGSGGVGTVAPAGCAKPAHRCEA